MNSCPTVHSREILWKETCRWEGAREDLQHAFELETAAGQPSALTLNNLGEPPPPYPFIAATPHKLPSIDKVDETVAPSPGISSF